MSITILCNGRYDNGIGYHLLASEVCIVRNLDILSAFFDKHYLSMINLLLSKIREFVARCVINRLMMTYALFNTK